MLGKLKTHVQDTARSHGNPAFVLYRSLMILNRRIKMPQAVLENAVNQMVRFGVYEQHLKPYMVPRDDGCFVDVGANVGRWTFYLASLNVEVHSFEPYTESYRILERQARHNPQIHTYNCALGDGEYMANISIHQGSGHNSLAIKSSDYIGHRDKVQVRTLDSFNIQNVGLIKIDTEGYEIPVLVGAKDTIARCSPRLVIEAHGDYEQEKTRITSFLKSMGYRVLVQYKPNSRQPHIIGERHKSFI